VWNLWTQTIQSIYTKPGTITHLKHSLGLWNPHFQAIRQWYATYDPCYGNIITKYPNESNKLFQPTHNTWSHKYYRQGYQTEQTPPHIYPVTPKQQKKMDSGPTTQSPNIILKHKPSHHQPLSISNNKYAISSLPKLWSILNCSNNPSTLDLNEYITHEQGTLLIVSNASLNAQQWSAFSWAISSTNSELWTGGGTSPETQHDVHSGRTKGYGLLAALTFFEKYLQAMETCIPPQPATILGYCDNSGLIQQVMSLQTNQILNPSLAITNNYDLANEIYQSIHHLPMPVKLKHVKGHQDQKTPIEELPYEAQLNIACNKQARENLKNLPFNTWPNPTLPHAYPHLRIHNQTIVQNPAAYMREYAQLPAYKLYLSDKFQWNPPHQSHWMANNQLCNAKIQLARQDTNLEDYPQMDSYPGFTRKLSQQRERQTMPYMQQVPRNTRTPVTLHQQIMKQSTSETQNTNVNTPHYAQPWPSSFSNVVVRNDHIGESHQPYHWLIPPGLPPNLP